MGQAIKKHNLIDNTQNLKAEQEKKVIISTKGRYALRVMIDLAENMDDNYIPMKIIAERQDISLKYLEKILPPLVKNDLILGVHGKGGGYMLTRKPEEYPIGEILRVTEGSLTPVACIGEDVQCIHNKACRTRPVWDNLYTLINEYLDSITIKDLMRTEEDDRLDEEYREQKIAEILDKIKINNRENDK